MPAAKPRARVSFSAPEAASKGLLFSRKKGLAMLPGLFILGESAGKSQVKSAAQENFATEESFDRYSAICQIFQNFDRLFLFLSKFCYF